MAKKRIKQSVVLTVSLKKGCYRHIRISVNETLEELADTILWAFDFCNDHAHAFFMDNRAWSGANCYYMAEMDEEEEYRHTCDVKLHELALQTGDRFLFVFDFGEEWRFQCKVLRLIDEDTDDSEIVKFVGEAPEQYPDQDWDEEE